MRVATGDYIYFLDSDDYIEPFCISRMMEMVKKYPGVELVQGGAVSSTGEVFMNLTNDALPDYTEDRAFIVRALLNVRIMPVNPWNKLIKRSVIIDNSLSFINGVIHEDMGWCYHLSHCVKSIAFCKYNTYNYLVRGGSLMTALHEEDSARSCLVLADDFIKNIDADFKDQHLGYIFRLLQSHYVFYQKRETQQKVHKYLCEIKKMMSLSDRLVVDTFLLCPTLLMKKRIIYKRYTNHFFK